MIKEEIQHLEQQYEKEVTGIVKKSGQLLRSKYGIWVMAAISFIDSAVAFPGPVDPFLAAYILANKKRAWLGFFVTVLASVLGGLMLYLLAAFFTDRVLDLFSDNTIASFNEVVRMFDQGTFTLSFLGAFTPIPYGLVVIAAGILKGNVLMFILGSILGRSIRFGIVAYLTYRYGEAALALAQRNLKLSSIILLALGAIYLLYKFLF